MKSDDDAVNWLLLLVFLLVALLIAGGIGAAVNIR